MSRVLLGAQPNAVSPSKISGRVEFLKWSGKMKSDMKIKPKSRRGLLNSRSVAEGFGPRFLDEEFCRGFLSDLIHMGNFCCPLCGHGISNKYFDAFYKNEPIYCPGCRKDFRAASGTILSYSKLSCSQIVLLALMLELGCSVESIAKRLGIARQAIPRWKKKLDFRKKVKSQNG